jgi:hypothetical protein
MNLTKKEIKALKTLLNYIAPDECEDAGGETDEGHIWGSIRPLYLKAFGKEELEKLEGFYKDET